MNTEKPTKIRNAIGQTKSQAWTVTFLWPVIVALSLCTSTARAKQEAVLFSKTIEGDFASNQNIPLNLVAGSPAHPELMTLKQVRFETAYSNAWRIMGRFEWRDHETSYWRITTELTDRLGRTLKHSRDNPTYLVLMKGTAQGNGLFQTELDLGAMHFEQRFHARGYRLCLERLEYNNEAGVDRSVTLSARDQTTQEPLKQAVLKVLSHDRSAPYKRAQCLYGMDSEGQARFSFAHSPSLSLSLEVQSPGHATVSKRFSGSEVIPDTYDVLLPSAGSIGGSVSNVNKQPVPEVWIKVQASQPLESANCSLYRMVKTNQQGMWTFNGIPKEAQRIDLKFKHPDYREASTRFTGLQTDHREILKPGLSVRGRVYDPHGKPAVDAVVHMVPMSYGEYRDNYMHVLTDDRGAFSFRCGRDDMTDVQSEKGVTLLLAEVPGYMPTIKQIKMGPDTPEVLMRLAPGHSVSGRVIDERGDPVPDAWTMVHPFPEQHKEYGLWQSNTDAQGRFAFEHVSEHVLLTIGKSGFIAVRDLSFPPETGDPVVHMIHAIHVTGNVKDATTGKPVGSFELSLCPVDDSGAPKQQRNQRWESFQQGTFEKIIDESFTGKRVAMIRANGYRPGTSPSFSMDQGSQSLDMSLTPDPSYKIARPQQPQKQIVKGTVLTPDKTPAANVTIYTYGRRAPDTMSAEDGTFKLVFPPSNRQDEACVIIARDRRNNLATAVDSFDLGQPLQVQLESGVTLLGKVLDPQGNGLPQARLSLYLWHSDTGYGKPENVSIQEDGRFVIAAVPRYQRYSVDFKASGYGSDYIRVETNDDISQIQLEPMVLKVADQSVSGVVVDQEGNPVPEIRIYAHGKGQPHLNTNTDQQGRFTVEGLVAGQVSLQANMHGERRMHGRTEVQVGDQHVKIIAEERDSRGRPIPPKRKSLMGKPIPDWDDLGLSGNAEVFRDRPMLICFWDMQQRPARRAVIQTAQKAQSLKDRGIGVLLVHATVIEKEALAPWLKKNRIPFPSGVITENVEQKKRQWGVESLPWWILTDDKHVVTAEGIAIDELDKDLKSLGEQQ
jgi:hypothetical protein